jgi:methylated-DNA-[protein]-cysteine S-methyltransferase
MKRSIMRYKSPVGILWCVFEGEYLIELSFGAAPELAPAGSPERPNRDFAKELDAYFAGNLKAFKQKVRFAVGTPFQHKVWLALKKIPPGSTRSYKWIAAHVGRPKAARAAGSALGRNPLPIILPCHRIIASDGTLGGFSGGLKTKEFLLRLEKRHS